MKIGIDIDDTIVSFFEEFAIFLNDNYKKDIRADDFGKGFFNILESKEKVLDALQKYVDEGHDTKSGFFEDFIECFKDLEERFEIYFITSRIYDLRNQTRKILKEKLNGHEPNIHYVEDYEKKEKSHVCKILGVDIIIEDSYRISLDCAKKGIKAFLLNKPWNQGREGHEYITRVNNWYEIREKLNAFN